MSHKDYYNYTIEDFLLDEKFVRWVRDSDDNGDFWKQFLLLYPEKSAVIHKAQQIVMATSVAPESLTSSEIRKEVERFLDQTLYAEEKVHSEKRPSIFSKRVIGRAGFGKIAAAVLILIAIGATFLFKEGATVIESSTISENKQSDNLIETINNTASSMNIVLSEGTNVVLSPGSSLKYPLQFHNERKVLLVGEANFSVTQLNEPFLVIAGEMVTKVLGTRFTVRAFANEKQSSVKVQSGKVSVYSLSHDTEADSDKLVKGLILTANQEGLFEKKDAHFSKTLVADPQPVKHISKYQETEYSEVPLSEILESLSDQFAIGIQHDKKSLKQCRITAVFSGETLYEQLDILCKIAAVNYQIVDGQIVISGEGCH